MNFWTVLKITSGVALVVILGILFIESPGTTQQPTSSSTPASSSSTDGAAFGNIK